MLSCVLLMLFSFAFNNRKECTGDANAIFSMSGTNKLIDASRDGNEWRNGFEHKAGDIEY